MTDSFIFENIAGSYRKISKGCHSNAFFAPRNRCKGKMAEDNRTEYSPSCHTHDENRRDARHGKTLFDISLSGKQTKGTAELIRNFARQCIEFDTFTCKKSPSRYSAVLCTFNFAH
ncbi:MAG: hypothetical protein LBL48_12230, partial [Azoarcus sp.]|nr:hypothetical protein [Azoarcus sp.]